MRGLEEGFQSGDEEERTRRKKKKKKKKKKKVRAKEEPMDEEGNSTVESSRAGLRDAAEVGLRITSEDNDEKKREKKKKKEEKKKRRNLEADDGSGGTTEAEAEEGAELAVENDEKQEGEKKKKTKKVRRKDEAGTSSKDCVPSAKKGKHGVKADKNGQDLKEGGESREAGENKKKKKKTMKDKVGKVGETLESFESGVLKSVSGNPEGRLDTGVEFKLEEDSVQHGDEKSLKETKVKQKKRERSSEDAVSFPECHTTKRLKDIAKDDRIAEEDSSYRSNDGKRRNKNFVEQHDLSSAEANKKKKRKKKAREELTELGEPELSNVSKRGLCTSSKPTVTAEETAGDDSCRMPSSSVSGDEKKTRKKKKTKIDRAEGMNVSAEGICSREIADKNKKTRNARKRSTVSADERTSSVENMDAPHTSTTTETSNKGKKVKFSSRVEVFPTTDDAKSNDQADEIHLIQGKRFSKEEDEMIKQAVFDYIEEKHLGEDGLDMVLKCRSHRQIKHCWKEIGGALPWRPSISIYYRAHTLFQRSEIRKWEPEELDLVRRYYNEHGPKWKEMAELLGKHRVHVKDTWRRIRLPNRKKGLWSQEEYQTLFDLVNVDLQLKAFEEKKTKHGMLRENISWSSISRKLDTRHEAACCLKWYQQLTSPMVTQGLWADTDDYLLIDALLKLDASCIEDVEWGSLLEHRPGDVCLRRWRQMARHIGGHRERSFMEQVELLGTRYCPNMSEFRVRTTQKCGGRDDSDDDDAEES